MDVVARRRGRPRKAPVVPAAQVPRTGLHEQAAARLRT